MSTPQGPYGPQNSYGPPPAQGPHSGGPYGSYGQQPPPHPPQGYGGWGAPPPPPPRKSRTGLVLGIVGGVVALVVAVVVGLAMVGSKVESGLPDARFELTLPQKLLDGRYELTDDLSDTQGRTVEDEMNGAWDAKVTKAKVAQYALGGDRTEGVLVISGMYGRFQHLAALRGGMFKGLGETDGVTVAVPAKDFRPDGADTTITCEVVTQKQRGGTATLTYPACAWADGNTAAMVAEMTSGGLHTDPADVDLEAAARTTLQVRSEARKAIR